MTNKKIKIHVKNNHWAPGSFPTDAEGEKNFTITKDRFDNVLNTFLEIKEKIEVFFDWDEENFKKYVVPTVAAINIIVFCDCCFFKSIEI